MAKPNIKLDLKALKLNPQKAKEIGRASCRERVYACV